MCISTGQMHFCKEPYRTAVSQTEKRAVMQQTNRPAEAQRIHVRCRIP